jgi:predicted dehydrogenase
MTDREVRLGIVGVGIMGKSHVHGLESIAGARLTAVCDWDADKARAVAEPLGAAVYTDGAKMIAEADIEALYICVPPHTHEDLELRAAARGLHLFVEKPVSLCMEQALKVQEAVRKAGVLTQVGYQLRYFPAYRQLHDFLADKEIGTAHTFRWSGHAGRPWCLKYDQSGGQLVEQTTHQIDLLRWIMGDVEAVSAGYSFNRLYKEEPEITIPDSQTALLHFRSGASATVSTSTALNKAWLGGMYFVLSGAKVSFNNDVVSVDPEGSYPIPLLQTEEMSADEAFVRAVATGDRSLLLSPYEDGLKTAAVTLAANRSAGDGGRLVKIDEMYS